MRYDVTTYADGFGTWHAKVLFEHTLSESDSRPEFNLDCKWSSIRRAARSAINAELQARENNPAPVRIDVHKQLMYGDNTWYGVEFVESDR